MRGYFEPLRKAELLDLQIETLQTDLFAKRDIRRRVDRERRTEEIGNLLHHRLGGRIVAAGNQCSDRVQRIEQEMRIDLVAQGAKLRVMGQALEVGDPPFALGKLEAVKQRHEKAGQRRIGPEPGQEIGEVANPGHAVHFGVVDEIFEDLEVDDRVGQGTKHSEKECDKEAQQEAGATEAPMDHCDEHGGDDRGACDTQTRREEATVRGRIHEVLRVAERGKLPRPEHQNDGEDKRIARQLCRRRNRGLVPGCVQSLIAPPGRTAIETISRARATIADLASAMVRHL